MMKQVLLIITVLIQIFFSAIALGHESQPGSLEIKQLGPNSYEFTWRAPIYYGKPHPARLLLPEEWQTVGQSTERRRPDA